MPATVNIPLTTLTVGPHDFGPAAAADTDSLVTITIDRTVANGLNSQTAATQITLTAYQSDDGGATWFQLASADVAGGTYTKNGVTVTTSDIGVRLQPGTGRQLKANLAVTGSSVAVAGTVTTQ